MKTKRFVLFLSLFVTLSFGFGCYLIYQKTTEDNILPIQKSFYNVLSYEGGVRFGKSGIPFSFSNVLPNEVIDTGFIRIQTEDTVSYIKKNPEYETIPILERQGHAIQTALILSGFPMKAKTIDSLLTEALHRQNIYADIGIRYVNNLTREIEDSKPGNPVYHESSTALIPLGLNDEIGVQAFYGKSFLSIFRQAPIQFVLLTVLWLAIITFFCRKPEKKVAYIPLSEMKTIQDGKHLLQLCPTLYFDPVKSEIRYHDQTIFLPNQLAMLFTAFMEAPDYFLNNEQIEKLLWPGMNNSHDSCNQAVKRIRNLLKPVPGMKIENVNRKGYQLKINIDQRADDNSRG